VIFKKTILATVCAGLVTAFAQDTADTMDTMDSMDTPDTGVEADDGTADVAGDALSLSEAAPKHKKFSLGINFRESYLIGGALQVNDPSQVKLTRSSIYLYKELDARVMNDILTSSGRQGFATTLSVAFKFQPTQWFALVPSVGAGILALQKTVQEQVYTRPLILGNESPSGYIEKKEAATIPTAQLSLGIQFTYPKFQNIHLDCDVATSTNLMGNDNFFIAPNSTAIYADAGVSYTIQLGQKSLDLGLKYGYMAYNNYTRDSDVYKHTNSGRLGLDLNLWLL